MPYGVLVIDTLIQTIIPGLLVVTAITTISLRNLYAATMVFGLFSLLCTVLFVVLDAVDVALTEAAVGAGLSTVMILATVLLTGKGQRTRIKLHIPTLAVMIAATILIALVLQDLPAVGDPQAPAHQHVAPRYIEQSPQEIGIPNMVTSVLSSYRGYDTLGEVIVIFCVGIGVLALFMGGGQRTSSSSSISAADAITHHAILRVICRAVLPLLLLFSLFIQFHGDFSPGGGFQAGVLFSSGFILCAIVFGTKATRMVIPLAVVKALAAIGVLLYSGVGIASLLYGGEYLNYSVLSGNTVAGQHLGILLIELGVGVVVASVMLLLFYVFSDDIS